MTDHRARIRYLDARSPMAAAVNDYLGAMLVKGYTHATVVSRSSHLGWLVAWLEDRGVSHPGEVTKPVLERFQRSLFYQRKTDGRPLSFRTQHQYLVSAKGLFRWLAKTNRILYNPASELELPRIEKRLPATVLGVGEVEATLAQADVNLPLGLRDRAIMEVFYSTGIRRSELVFLAVTDLDLADGTLMVRQGKGRKDRVVPIGERAIAWVDRYLVEVRPRLVVPPDNHLLFLNTAGKEIRPNQLSYLITRYIGAATGRSGSCHVFRHTMATLMLEGGADIRHVQEMLGHADIGNTQIYTRVSIRHLKAVHAACHPGATNTHHRTAPELYPSPGEPAATHDDLMAVLDAEQQEEEDDRPRTDGGGRSAAGEMAALDTTTLVEENHHDHPQTRRVHHG